MDLIYFLGRFHVLALHVPIGIVLAVVVLQWLARSRPYRHLESAAPFLWGAAAVSAVVTAVLGYLHFAEGAFEGPAATSHRLYGTAVAVLTVLVWLAAARCAPLYRRFGLVAGVLVVALVTLTGHYGGNLTHGSTYLVAYAPGPLRALAGLDAARPAVTDVLRADPYHDLIRPILESRCGTCHNDDKLTGGFSVATYDSTLVGGDTGRAVVPGNLNASELHYRVTLPRDSDEFMPAEGKTPLTERQVELVRWWIEAGAPVDTTVGEVGVVPDIGALLEAELGLGGAAASAPSVATTADDPALVTRLYAAGFLARQVAQNDPRLTVSVSSPGRPLGQDALLVLAMAAEKIIELNLQSSALEDGALAELGRFTQLTRLRLSDNRLTDAGLRWLAPLERLEYLNLYGNAGVTDAGLASLAALASLTELYLWRTGVTAAGVARLREQRPGLAVDTGVTGTLVAAGSSPQ